MMSTNLYTIKHLTTSQVSEIDMNDIICDKLHGFIVEDFLNNDEVQNLLTGLRTVDENKLIHIEKGFDSYPMSFAQFDQMVERGLLTEENYFNASNEFISTFTNHFKVDVLQKLNDVFCNIKNSLPIYIPNANNYHESYVPFTFRELFPGDGCLKAHCENLFYIEFPSFFKKINAFSKSENQLSFFIVLQKPETTGELSLFDIKWNNKQKRINDHLIKMQNEDLFDFDNPQSIKRDTFAPSVGSLVIFKGGDIWHRVEKVMTSPSRITLGGFLSFSHDNSKLYSWS